MRLLWTSFATVLFLAYMAAGVSLAILWCGI